MGCASSSELWSPFLNLHPLVFENQPFIKKVKAFEAIKKNDPFLVEKILEEVQPTENLGSEKENHTCLHVAAEHNSFQAMNVLISWLQENRADDIAGIFEIPDSKGHNPVEKCIVHNSTETFYVVLKANVVDLKDKKKREPLEWLCNEFSKDCLEVLAKYEKEQGVEEDPAKKISIAPKTDQRKINNLEQRVQKVSSVSSKQIKKGAQGNPALKGIPSTSKIYQLLSDLASGNRNFQDTQFPQLARSLTTDSGHKFFNQFKNAVWKRPTELFSSSDFSDIKLFDTIDPHDIEQGILGVCYFLCSLSALAEFPSRLSKVFVNQTANQYGAYALKFYISGVPTEIIVDDYIPCYGDRKQVLPLFSKPKGKELWVLLAEKAWGKLYNNYVASEAGRPEEALEYLTGAPAVCHLTEEETPDQIFAAILAADKKNHVICASTNAQANEKVGLVSHHAYSVISAHQVGKHRVLKLRNPWGNLEWNGDFGDNSKLWTDALKKAVGYANADDGMFCMTPEDFKKFFSSYSVCFYNDGWEYSFVESQSEKNHADYYRFTIEDPCDLYLRIHQEDKRFYDQAGKQYDYSSADLFVAKVEADGSYTPIVDDEELLHNGTYFGKRSIYPVDGMKLQLKEAGQYVVRAKIRWIQGTRGKYTISTYAPFKINLQKIHPVKDYLRRFFKSLGKDLEKKDVGNSCSYASAHYGPYFYTYWENKHPTKNWTLNVTFTKMDNLRIDTLLKTGDNSIKMEIPAGTSSVAILKRIDLPTGPSVGWTFKSQWK